jgi:hypothetical protein
VSSCSLCASFANKGLLQVQCLLSQSRRRRPPCLRNPQPLHLQQLNHRKPADKSPRVSIAVVSIFFWCNSLPAPIIHRYQTPRSAPVPLVAPASYQPFLGMSTLAPSAASLNTGHANQERMLSANAVLPRGPSLVRRRPRGVARHPPSLARRAQIDQCFVEDAPVPTIRVLSIIYPPHVSDHFQGFRLLFNIFAGPRGP